MQRTSRCLPVRFAIIKTMEPRLVHNRLPERQRHYESELVYWGRAACKEPWLQDDAFPMPLARGRLGRLQPRALYAYR